jgi:hypothetical protein
MCDMHAQLGPDGRFEMRAAYCNRRLKITCCNSGCAAPRTRVEEACSSACMRRARQPERAKERGPAVAAARGWLFCNAVG